MIRVDIIPYPGLISKKSIKKFKGRKSRRSFVEEGLVIHIDLIFLKRTKLRLNY